MSRHRTAHAVLALALALFAFLSVVPAQAQEPPWERTYPTMDAAAASILDWVSERPSEYDLSNREVGGWVIQTDEGYQPREPQRGPNGGGFVDPGMPKPQNAVAFYHTHTFTNDSDFSDRETQTSSSDHRFARDNAVVAYLKVPDGSIYAYSPENGEEQLQIGNGNSWTDPEDRTEAERYEPLEIAATGG